MTNLTDQELYELYVKMREERVKSNLRPPFEPSCMEFGSRVAKIAYARGYRAGYGDSTNDFLSREEN